MLFTHPFIHLFICSQLALDIEKAAVNLVILSDTPELTVQEVMHKYGLIATACLFCNAPMHEVFQCVVNVTTIHHNHNHNQSNNRSNYNNNHNIARNINMMSPDVSPQSNFLSQTQSNIHSSAQIPVKSSQSNIDRGQVEGQNQGLKQVGQGQRQGQGQDHERDQETIQQEDKKQWVEWIRQLDVEVQGQGQGSGLRLGRLFFITSTTSTPLVVSLLQLLRSRFPLFPLVSLCTPVHSFTKP